MKLEKWRKKMKRVLNEVAKIVLEILLACLGVLIAVTAAAFLLPAIILAVLGFYIDAAIEALE
jgi:hypothetical protein